MEYDTDPLRYNVWIEDALRTVIKRTISYVSENGLPGEHHFYITFRTTDDKVIMPDYLRADHPEEMTIVLQYQYDSLDVDDDDGEFGHAGVSEGFGFQSETGAGRSGDGEMSGVGGTEGE